jgi:hypothetical protein
MNNNFSKTEFQTEFQTEISLIEPKPPEDLGSGGSFSIPTISEPLQAIPFVDSCGFVLPYSYKVFLKNFGKGAGRLMDDVDIFYDSIFNLTKKAREILQDEGDPILPENAFVFTMREGQFFFFKVDEITEDPPIFYYMELATEFIKKQDSIWNFVEEEIKFVEGSIS